MQEALHIGAMGKAIMEICLVLEEEEYKVAEMNETDPWVGMGKYLLGRSRFAEWGFKVLRAIRS